MTDLDQEENDKMTEHEAAVPFAGTSEFAMHAPWRRIATSLLSVSLLCVFTLAAQTAKADSITFNDTTSDNIVSVSGGSTRVTTAAACTVPAEICSITLAAPTGSTFASSTGLLPITFIGEGNGKVSDELIFAVSKDNTFVTLTFLSDFNGVGLGTCPETPACVSETGVSKLVGSIVWSDASTDSINFASDLPEGAGVVP